MKKVLLAIGMAAAVFALGFMSCDSGVTPIPNGLRDAKDGHEYNRVNPDTSYVMPHDKGVSPTKPY